MCEVLIGFNSLPHPRTQDTEETKGAMLETQPRLVFFAAHFCHRQRFGGACNHTVFFTIAMRLLVVKKMRESELTHLSAQIPTLKNTA